MGFDELLKQRLAANPSDMPGFARDLEDVARRTARHRRHRHVVNVAVWVLVGLGVIIPIVAIAPLAGHGRQPSHPGSSPALGTSATPSPSPYSDPFDRPPLKHVSLVTQHVLSSSADSLVIEAPVGAARWSLHGCEVMGGSADGTSPRSGGFGSGTCGGGTQLSAGVGGLSICPWSCPPSSGTFYEVISGRTLPDPGVHIDVTFIDGTTTTVRPSLGLWMVVFRPHPENYNPTSPIAIVKAVAMDGTILATERV